MADAYERFAREKTTVAPSSNYILHCPFCDDWRLTDSMVARKKLGLHISDRHPDDVRFRRGTKPPALEQV